jgi:ABC-type Na+ efflux pump permease subunit
MQNSAPNHDDECPPTTNRLTEASRDQSASQQLGEANREARRLGQRHTVKEAAEVLGTTVDAVRGRIRRGTLDSVKLDSVVYVLLDETNREQQNDKSTSVADDTRQQTADQSELVGELRGQVEWLRREVERKDTIIMQMAQRIPELESPAGQRDDSKTVSEGKDKGEVPPESQESTQRRSGLYRFFFGP